MKTARMNLSLIPAALSLVVTLLLSFNTAHAEPADPTPFYPKTATQKTKLMSEFGRLFDDSDVSSGRVAKPFKFEGRSRWHVNTGLYQRCLRLNLAPADCVKSATIPNREGTLAAPRESQKDDFTISVNSPEIFYSCSAELFVGNEDHETAKSALEIVQETYPQVTKPPFVVVDCNCEPQSKNHQFKENHATSCDIFGYPTDASGN